MTNPGLPHIYRLSGHAIGKIGKARGYYLKPKQEERFRLLYSEHVEDILRYVARRTTSDELQDVVADTFLIAWKRIDSIPEDGLPWLFATARNVMANRFRSTKRRTALEVKLSSARTSQVPTDSTPLFSEVDERLAAAISDSGS